MNNLLKILLTTYRCNTSQHDGLNTDLCTSQLDGHFTETHDCNGKLAASVGVLKRIETDFVETLRCLPLTLSMNAFVVQTMCNAQMPRLMPRHGFGE